MEFNFTSEEKMLQNSVREYLKDKIISVASEEDQKGPLSTEHARRLLTSLIPFGYIGSLTPEKNGGPELSYTEAGIILMELGKAWASLGAISATTSNAISVILSSKNKDIIKRVLSPLLHAEKTGCIALTEPWAGTDLSGIRTTAVPDGEHYIINGTKTWISNGSIADLVLLITNISESAQGQNSLGLILVERDVSPYTADEIPKMGLKALSTAKLEFKDCHVPIENLISPRGEGLNLIKQVLNEEKCHISAVAIGIAEASLETSVTYAKQREQFGKPIGQFQMIQQMIAEMATGLDAAKLLCFRAFKMLDDGIRCPKEIAMAKAYISEMTVDVTSKAIQIHGAYGYSDEFPMERHYRDAHCLTVMEGSTQIQQLLVAREILGLSALH